MVMCFRDMAFCKYWKKCAKGEECRRALTEKVKEDAEKWWGGKNYPISWFADKPECFIKKEKKKSGD